MFHAQEQNKSSISTKNKNVMLLVKHVKRDYFCIDWDIINPVIMFRMVLILFSTERIMNSLDIKNAGAIN